MKDEQTSNITSAMRNGSAATASLKATVQSLITNEIDAALTALFRDTTNDGREVNLALAQSCILRYKQEMISRYILVPGVDPVPTQPNTTIQMATHYVNFNGRGLKEWILEQIYGPIAVDAVDFKLANGIYTEEFLEFYFPGNEPEKEKRRNRITYFIIPFEIDTTNMFSGGKAYDLGGLEP